MSSPYVRLLVMMPPPKCCCQAVTRGRRRGRLATTLRWRQKKSRSSMVCSVGITGDHPSSSRMRPRVADDDGVVVRPIPRGVDLDADGRSARARAACRAARRSGGAARADVVHALGPPAFDDRAIGSTVSRTSVRSRLASRLPTAISAAAAARLDVGNPAGEPRGGEDRILPRTEVIERPRDRTGEAAPLPMDTSSCASLLNPYGLDGRTRLSSRSGSSVGRVHHRRARNQHAASRSRPLRSASKR